MNHRATVEKALRYIQANLDGDLTPAGVAAEVSFSSFHFQRMFRAVTGESFMDHVRRLRLERAAHRLRNSPTTVAWAALEAGYDAHEAFTRAFQAHYGLPPHAYRRTRLSHWIPARNCVHFDPDGFSPLRFHAPDPGSARIEVDEAVEVLLALTQLLPEDDMNPTLTIDDEIRELEEQVEQAKARLAEARRRRAPEPVQDYVLKDANGAVRLSELFGEKSDLVLVHNMGTGCVYCTMWADGFTGLVPHLSDRTAFVVASPDRPEVQKRFAENRGWNFRMVSLEGSSLNPDLGFYDETSTWIKDLPGVSTFRKNEGGQIVRIAKAAFGPGDDFCVTWPMLDLLDGGHMGWEPQYDYAQAQTSSCSCCKE